MVRSTERAHGWGSQPDHDRRPAMLYDRILDFGSIERIVAQAHSKYEGHEGARIEYCKANGVDLQNAERLLETVKALAALYAGAPHKLRIKVGTIKPHVLRQLLREGRCPLCRGHPRHTQAMCPMVPPDVTVEWVP